MVPTDRLLNITNNFRVLNGESAGLLTVNIFHTPNKSIKINSSFIVLGAKKIDKIVYAITAWLNHHLSYTFGIRDYNLFVPKVRAR